MPSPARPRHVAFSAKQKKEYLQTKRAIKRGELDPERLPQSNGRTKIDKSDKSRSDEQDLLELHSTFLALPPDYTEQKRNDAWADQLERPIPESAAYFPLAFVDNPHTRRLTIPSRPAAGQTTSEQLDQNERDVFRTWLANARDTVDAWVRAGNSPTQFETNLEVWRQLWRVVEASSIILLLVDARCPPLHCPPSLRAYLQQYRPRREIVLVLTKADLVEPTALQAWKGWLREWWAHEIDIVPVTCDARPAMPQASRGALVRALRNAHGRLRSSPTDAADGHTNLPSVHWEELEGDVRVRLELQEQQGDAQHGATPGHLAQPLTVGLVGQPNVGKSSLLNALLGKTRVRASRTPGKTKHWQTMLWGDRREVRIVDCPGLVCPSLVPMELQAMAGILSIAQIPSLPACISYAARCLPLECVYALSPPEPEVDPMEGKRTWRKGMVVAPPKPCGPRWTAGEIMERRARDRGFATARSARPDSNRAADGMMRALADGRIRWGFWPPGSAVPQREGAGIWLGAAGDRHRPSDSNNWRPGAGVTDVEGGKVEADNERVCQLICETDPDPAHKDHAHSLPVRFAVLTTVET